MPRNAKNRPSHLAGAVLIFRRHSQGADHSNRVLVSRFETISSRASVAPFALML